MKYEIIYLQTVWDDINEIKINLSQYYPSTYKIFFTKLERHIKRLEDNPDIGQEWLYLKPFRRLIVDNYLVFYIIDKAKRIIEIHHVLHGARDLKNTKI